MMETYENGSGTVETVSSCVPAIVPGKKRVSRGRKIASGCVFWIGMALVGMVAVPAGILCGIIYLIVKLTSFLTDKIEKE